MSSDENEKRTASRNTSECTVLVLFFQNISGNYLEMSTALGIFWMVIALLEYPFGHLSDKFGKRKFIIIGGIISSISTLSYLLVKSTTQLYLIEALSGIATSMQTPAINSLISDNSLKKNRGKTFGLFNSSINFSYGLASILSGVFVTIFGLSYIFIISSAFQVCSTAVVCKIKR